MPHSRLRHAVPLLLKRLKLWPVLGLLGPRQVGKTTLLREQISPTIKATYLTMDSKQYREAAIRAPDHFLESHFQEGASALILDEVQKVPDLFDAVKASVDLERRPGRFILSGSTEFSRKTGVRESLTGRIGLRRLYPLTLAECLGNKASVPWVRTTHGSAEVLNTDVSRWIERGGMPGICFLRESGERAAAIETWLETTCFRDIQQIRGARLSGELAKEVLEVLARLERPTAAEVASKLKTDARRIRNHLEALEALFVLQRLDPHPSGTGKPHYQIFDAGVAAFLGASFSARLKIWALNECLAQYEYSGEVRPKIHYYESSKHARVDLVIEDRKSLKAVVLTDEEAPGPYVFRGLESFRGRLKQESVSFHGILLAPVAARMKVSKDCALVPWGSMG